MPKFSDTSMKRLADAHPLLQGILEHVIQYLDIVILCTYRGEAEQNKAVAEGKSKLAYPNSKHNHIPSRAVDVGIYNPALKGVNWNDKDSFYYLAGYIKAVADYSGIPIRWGGDWDSDGDFKDNMFQDLPHYELK